MNKGSPSILKLNLGSGKTSYPGFTNVDKIKFSNVDIVWDLEKTPFPFKDNSVSEIITEHTLEHIRNFLPLVEDLYRICRPDGLIKIAVPYFKYEGAFRDPTHVRFFTERSFDHFNIVYDYNYYSKARFKVRKIELRNVSKTSVQNFYKRIIKFIPFKKFLNMFLWNMYSEIYYELVVVK